MDGIDGDVLTDRRSLNREGCYVPHYEALLFSSTQKPALGQPVKFAKLESNSSAVVMATFISSKRSVGSGTNNTGMSTLVTLLR